MSTRASILIKDNSESSVRLYHHHDGYPEGVGMDLVERLNKTFEYYGWEQFANRLVKDSKDEYELTSDIHGDEEYLYEVDVIARTVVCKKRNGTIVEIPKSQKESK